MRRWVIAALASGLLLGVLATTPAHAAPSQADDDLVVDDCDDNYSDTNIINLDPADPGPGDEVTLTGEGFEPGVTVDILLEPATGPPPSTLLGTSVIGDFETPEAGKLNATVTLPDPLDPGVWTIKVISQKCSADEGSVDFTIPGDVADNRGTQNGGVLGTGTGVTPAAQVKAATQGSGVLATTGSNRTLSLAGLAVGLLALGGVSATTGSRRRARSNSDSA